ncbi:MAG: hypothetical protein GY718_18070, partial [Lentisphaerae bacterium]|nr:hypothetical protein [Lentisphaerota bacterium]
LDAANYEPTTVRGDFLSSDEVPGMQSCSINFRVALHGDGAGTKGVAPEYADALLACGYLETIVAATSVTYTPTSTFDGSTPAGQRYPAASYSVTVLEDGVAYKLKGGFGNVVFEGVVGEPMFANFTFSGAFSDVDDDALETVTYDVGAPPSFRGASFALGGAIGAYTPRGVQNVTLDTGNQVVAVADINDDSGVYGARIVGRKSVGSFDPEMVLVATNPYYDDWKAGTTGSITTGVIG